MKHNLSKRRGFSLIELVIVVVIIAIIAAIAIPKMSRAASGATDAALAQNLAQMRSAIDLFAAEHAGTYPTAANIVAQLTTFSDASGAASGTKSATHIYGPYLKAIPPLPVGGATVKGLTTITGTGPAGTGAFGWLYTAATGDIIANTGASDSDVTGKLYNLY